MKPITRTIFSALYIFCTSKTYTCIIGFDSQTLDLLFEIASELIEYINIRDEDSSWTKVYREQRFSFRLRVYVITKKTLKKKTNK